MTRLGSITLAIADEDVQQVGTEMTVTSGKIALNGTVVLLPWIAPVPGGVVIPVHATRPIRMPRSDSDPPWAAAVLASRESTSMPCRHL